MHDWREALLERYVPSVWPGIDVGDGWRPLVEAFYKIVDDNDYLSVAQVKEKFGTIRLYFDTDWDALEDIDVIERGIEEYRIRSAREQIAGLELASEYMCEQCGAYGTATNEHRLIRTLCEACRP